MSSDKHGYGLFPEVGVFENYVIFNLIDDFISRSDFIKYYKRGHNYKGKQYAGRYNSSLSKYELIRHGHLEDLMSDAANRHAVRVQRQSLNWQSAVVQAFAVVVGMVTIFKINAFLGMLFTVGMFLYGLSLSRYWACSECNARLGDDMPSVCRNCGARLE